jgi:iron complex transport system substrate-binding protein
MVAAGWVVPTLLLALMICGCAKKPDRVEIPHGENAQMRIISMAPNLTEILFELGVGDQIVGVTKFSTYPPEAKEIKNVGTFWQPDIEAVLACRPTLVLTLGFAQQTVLADRLKHIGCEAMTLDIESIDQLYTAIKIIGDTVNKAPKAQSLIENLQHKQKQLVDKYASKNPRKVLWVIQREPLRVSGTNTFINELIEVAGGVNAIDDTIHQYPPISDEEVIGSMPDVIIEPVMDPEQFQTQKQTAKEFYKQFWMVPAVQNERICIIDGDLVSRLGPRLDEGLRMIAECIWSE